LAKYDGKEGRPAYVAYRGLVFDVSGSMRWAGGRHQERHDAGQDLTEELKEAPHGTTILLRVPIIGRLKR
jgi:predicted heme/steroid binding protein